MIAPPKASCHRKTMGCFLLSAIICSSAVSCTAAEKERHAFLTAPAERASMLKGLLGLPVTIQALQRPVSFLEGGANQREALVPDPFNVVCEDDGFLVGGPLPHSRENNIEELELILRDTGLEHAADKLWLVFYGSEDSTTVARVEEWVDKFLSLLTSGETPGEGGSTTSAHKALLFFLRHMLKETESASGKGGVAGGLQEALLEKLRRIAGVALGGNLLGPSVGRVQEGLQDVQRHNEQAGNGQDEVSSSRFPRSLVPIVGTRNPFFAYTGFDFYFGEGGKVLPFVSWPSLLTSLSAESSYQLDAMCSVQQRRSRFNIVPSWMRGRGRPVTRASKRVSSLKPSSHRTLCELSDRLLSSLGEFVKAQTAVLARSGVPLEPGVPHIQNLKRLHTDTCMPGQNGHIQIPCLFEESRLAQESRALIKPEDDENQQTRHRAQAELIKQAHTTISGLGHARKVNAGDWGLRPLSGDEQNERGKKKVLERLNVAVATLLTTSSLDSAANYWLAFDSRTVQRATKAFQTSIIQALKPVGMKDIAYSLLRRPTTDVVSETFDAALNVLKGLGGTPDGLRVALALYSILPILSPQPPSSPSVLTTIKEILGDEKKPLFQAIRDNPLVGSAMADSGALQAATHIWIFAFLSERQGYPQQKELVLRNPIWVKILHTHGFMPKFVRKLFFKFTAGFLKQTREKQIQKARNELLKKLPVNFFESLFSPFKFTAHSGALMQVNNFHSMKHDEIGGDYERLMGEGKPFNLRQKSVADSMDAQIKGWAQHGMDPTLLESHRDFESFKRAWSKIDLKDLPLPDITDWYRRLSSIVTQGLEAYVGLEKHLEYLNDTVYTLATDSLRHIQADQGQTLFFTRMAHNKREGKFRRSWERTKKSLLSLLYRAPTREHGVWFGVVVDFEQLHALLDQVKHVIENAPSLSIKVNMEEAFLREVEAALLLRGTDISRAPLLAERNIGMLGVRREYASLPEAERDAEFQTSTCLDHCRGLWQLALSSMLPTMLRPELMQQYEKTFGTNWALKKLSDPVLVNSRRMIFKSDTALNFFDYSTPKEVREEIKGLQSGQGTMFAYSLLFASRAHHRLGNQYLALHLQQQAPYMGNMVLEWLATRRRHAVDALVSSVVLSFLGTYAVMSFLDILQNLTVSGAMPPFDCVWNPVMQEMGCSPVPGGTSLNTAWSTALEQVFLIGLFSGSGAGVSLLLAARSAIAIVVNQSKTLMRLQMCLSSTVMRLFRRGAKSFSQVREYYKKRNVVKRVMMKRALLSIKPKAESASVGTSEALAEADNLLNKLVGRGRLMVTPRSQK